jgi:hypothetical protein
MLALYTVLPRPRADSNSLTQITSEEQQAIIRGFADRSQFQARGILLGGHKFIYTGDHGDPNRITGKKGVRRRPRCRYRLL